MPLRFPPTEPTPPKRGSSPEQQKRYRQALHAWFVGNALREYAESLTAKGRVIADDISIMSSPRLDSIGGGKRYNENGTPRSMDDVCASIDRQARVVAPVGKSYKELQVQKPRVATVVWMRHVSLLSIEEIADACDISTRTVIRFLGVANLYLMAALSGKQENGKTARQLVTQAERLSASPEDADVNAGELSLAGVEAQPPKRTPKRK